MKNNFYWWMKLPADFFESEEIVRLLMEPKGPEAVLYYLKLACRSLKNGGKFTETDPRFFETLVGHCPNFVPEMSHELLKKVGLIVEKNGQLLLPKVQEMTERESTETTRKRAYRARQATAQNDGTMSQKCPGTFGTLSRDIVPKMSRISRIREDIDIDKDLDQETVDAWEKTIGTLTDEGKKELTEMAGTFGKEEVLKAIEKAARHGAKSLAYLRAMFKKTDHKKVSPTVTAEEIDLFGQSLELTDEEIRKNRGALKLYICAEKSAKAEGRQLDMEITVNADREIEYIKRSAKK